MKLISEVSIEQPPFSIQYQDSLFFIGSCFSDEMSSKTQYFSYPTFANPYGTVYNSSAIRQQIESICSNDFRFEDYLQEHDGEWLSVLHNTQFRSINRDVLLAKCKKVQLAAKAALEQANYIFITLGTATVYEHIEKQLIVANNQKLPSYMFSPKSLTVTKIVEDVLQIQKQVQTINPTIQFVLTVSPVRHQKNGFVSNQRSKAKLVVAVEEICQSTDAFYFPSYELVLDEMRDYRFFASDYCHLNPLGVEYVWEKFEATLLDPNESKIRKRVNTYRKLAAHRVMDIEKQEQHHQKIIESKQQIKEDFGIIIQGL